MKLSIIKQNNISILTNNQLKFIAALFMTVDHIGYILFPQYIILRISGRLSFPIFAYTISEGCRHTKNRTRYLLTLLVSAVVFQVGYTVITQSLMMNIFVTFTLSVVIILLSDKIKKEGTRSANFIFILFLVAVFALCNLLPYLLPDFCIDYGFFGVLLPLWCYLGRTKNEKLLFLTAGLIPICISFGAVQWFSLLAVPIISLYNDKRGNIRLKWFFYMYYPLHIVLIYFLSLII